MPFIWEIIILLHRFHISLWMEWVPSADNTAADALSRFNIPGFKRYARSVNWLVDAKPICVHSSTTLQFPMFDYESDIDELERLRDYLCIHPSRRSQFGPVWWAPELQHLFSTVPDNYR